MNKKYHCPHHEESTPSAVAYANGYYSFCCGKSGPLSELGLAPGERIDITYKEDLPSSIARIKSLPKSEIRGFRLHTDSTGYYILWDDDSYYKKRIYGAASGNKYRGPSGHTKPWFCPAEGDMYNPEKIYLIEGELNALSFATLEPGDAVASPGGAGDFYSNYGQKEMARRCPHYGIVHIVVDADAAGAQAAIETKAKLITLGCPDVRIHLVETDFNQILCDSGKEALRDECKRLGLFGV